MPAPARALSLALLLAAVLAAAAWAAQIVGTAGDDTLTGTAGDDVLFGLAGNDRLDAGAGNDTLDGGPGTDDMAGGSGGDAASYATATKGVTVTLDDLANDGAVGESDNVQADIEDVFGGSGADALEGSAGPNTLDGGDGGDVLDGGSGADFLFGGVGDDRLSARDGRADTVDCGDGTDGAFVDPLDSVIGCEFVDNRAAVALADGTVRNQWTATSRFTKVNLLLVLDVSPAASRVQVRCSGKGCPIKSRTKAAASRVNLRPLFRRAKLRVGTRVEVRISGAAAVGKVVRFRMRSLALPSVTYLCLPAGSSRPRAAC